MPDDSSHAVHDDSHPDPTVTLALTVIDGDTLTLIGPRSSPRRRRRPSWADDHSVGEPLSGNRNAARP